MRHRITIEWRNFKPPEKTACFEAFRWSLIYDESIRKELAKSETNNLVKQKKKLKQNDVNIDVVI